jgi:hypothetical protein
LIGSEIEKWDGKGFEVLAASGYMSKVLARSSIVVESIMVCVV